ncbi:MAG TPA: YggT family protein [Burkholderiales bacterium]|jgi:YggT family protein|nr:YggT family protein [Burkholderiales bacterium]
MLIQTLIFLVTTVGDLFVLALLLRFVLQAVRAPARNPLSQFLAALTDFVVRPVRRVIPGWWGLDIGTLLLAWLTAIVELSIVFTIKGYDLSSASGIAVAALAALAALTLVRLAIYIVMVAVIAQAILSWVQPYNALSPMLSSVTRPFLRPFQKRIPPLANFDLSPFFVVIICQLLLTVPLVWLEATVGRVL